MNTVTPAPGATFRSFEELMALDYAGMLTIPPEELEELTKDERKKLSSRKSYLKSKDAMAAKPASEQPAPAVPDEGADRFTDDFGSSVARDEGGSRSWTRSSRLSTTPSPAAIRQRPRS